MEETLSVVKMSEINMDYQLLERLIEDSIFAYVFSEYGWSGQSEFMLYYAGEISEELRTELVRFNVTTNRLDFIRITSFIYSRLDVFHHQLLRRIRSGEDIQPRFKRQLCMAIIIGAAVYLDLEKNEYVSEILTRLKSFRQLFEDVKRNRINLCAMFLDALVARTLQPMEVFDNLPSLKVRSGDMM